jgi:hypothetical protein
MATARDRAAYVYRLVITYPPGSREPGWLPAAYTDPDGPFSWRLRRHLRRAGFRWPAERLFLSSSGAHNRAWRLRYYGAQVRVQRSDLVTWADDQFDEPPEPVRACPACLPEWMAWQRVRSDLGQAKRLEVAEICQQFHSAVPAAARLQLA